MKRVVITGGNGALGQAMAKVFLNAGWEVSAPSREELDVSSDQSISRYFLGKEIDLLVCNAGLTRDGLLARQSVEDWNEVFSVNYEGAARCAGEVLPVMSLRKRGHIIFISSFSAVQPPLGQVAYASAKAALLGLTKELAQGFGSEGIRVNAILPGFLETRMTESVTPSRREEVRKNHVLGRFNTVREVAEFVRFLEENLPHTSGQIFQLDSRC